MSGLEERCAVTQWQFVQCQIEVNAPDKSGAVQNVSFDPAAERPAEDQNQLVVFGEVKVPGGFQLAQKGRILRAEPIDLIKDNDPFSRCRPVRQDPQQRIPIICPWGWYCECARELRGKVFSFVACRDFLVGSHPCEQNGSITGETGCEFSGQPALAHPAASFDDNQTRDVEPCKLLEFRELKIPANKCGHTEMRFGEVEEGSELTSPNRKFPIW